MAMGRKPAARQGSPMWVSTADLPTSGGHPFVAELDELLALVLRGAPAADAVAQAAAPVGRTP